MPLLKLLVLTSLLLCAPGVSAESQQNQAPLSQAELEQILAPIALYPDSVLSHILVAATYPLEVVQAERWTAENPTLRGSQAVQAVDRKDWDPSVRALVAFPRVLKRMSHDLQWTQKLGEAFLQDEKRVLASVQDLRQLAERAGSLKDLDKVAVSRHDNAIVIEPIQREVVYVPYYNTRTVYGAWRWAHHDPVYWDCPYHSHSHSHRHSSLHDSRFYWGPSVSISFGFHFNALHWRDRHIVRIPYHYYRPNRYYNRHQIITHDYAQRWSHDPFHRRGVIYRNRQLRNHYTSRHATRRPVYERAASPHNSQPVRPRQVHTYPQQIKRYNRRAAPARQNATEPIHPSDLPVRNYRSRRVHSTPPSDSPPVTTSQPTPPRQPAQVVKPQVQTQTQNARTVRRTNNTAQPSQSQSRQQQTTTRSRAARRAKHRQTYDPK